MVWNSIALCYYKLNTRNRLLLLAFTGYLLISCKTSFRISVKEPAVVDIPSETTKFGVVNSVTRANSPEEVIGTVISGGSIHGNVVAAERAVDGIYRGLENS